MQPSVPSHPPVTVTVRHEHNGRLVETSAPFGTIAAAAERLKTYGRKRDITGLALRLSECDSEVSLVDISIIFSLELPNLKILKLISTLPTNDMYDYTQSFDMEPYPTNSSADFEDFLSAHAIANPPAFSYHHFLDALSRWSTLETILIDNFLHIPSKDPSNLPRLLCPLVWPNLKDFELRDLPNRVRSLLGYLHLPVHANVHLRGSTGLRPLEADMMQEMLPLQPSIYQNIELLDRARFVNVQVGPDALLVGGATPVPKEHLNMQVLPSSTGSFDTRDVRGGLLRSLLRSLPDMFNPSVVTFLRIRGDITWIGSSDDWTGIFTPFHKLEVLILADDTRGLHGFAGAVFDSLAGDGFDVQERRIAPVCPRLRFLILMGVSVSTGDIGIMRRTLKRRKEKGYPVSALKLELEVNKCDNTEAQRAVDSLASAVTETVEWRDMRTNYVHIPSSAPVPRKRRR